MTVLLTSCSIISQSTYDRIHVGTLQGKLIVEWIDIDTFIFIPDETTPLTFTRYNGEMIQPGKMYTDGGTIPRPLWAFRNYSPWGYAPAYIVHDWLYQRYQCQDQIKYVDDVIVYSFEESAMIMAEVIKTMMLNDGIINSSSKRVLLLLYGAVQTPMARESYEHGECQMLSRTIQKPIFSYEIDYTK